MINAEANFPDSDCIIWVHCDVTHSVFVMQLFAVTKDLRQTKLVLYYTVIVKAGCKVSDFIIAIKAYGYLYIKPIICTKCEGFFVFISSCSLKHNYC